MLIGTTDEHERRTLVEDTVGKILLACWRGVKFEIMQVLREVVDRYINDEAVMYKRTLRVPPLYNVQQVFVQAFEHIPHDSLNPMRRIMDDALHRVSKH
ncbi:hypothetical protein EDC04DRAFT_2671548 [Pisolithus marmoratus]|nr:hypothetical protein EDC04DRAFT_2671548 [Pisolithus marmoratus]